MGSLESAVPQPQGGTALAGRSTAVEAVLGFIAEMVSAGRVTVSPAFALRLVSHLVARAKAELAEELPASASRGAAGADCAPPQTAHKKAGGSGGSKAGRAGGEEAVMAFIRAVGVWGIDETAPPSHQGGGSNRGWGGDRLSVEVNTCSGRW